MAFAAIFSTKGVEIGWLQICVSAAHLVDLIASRRRVEDSVCRDLLRRQPAGPVNSPSRQNKSPTVSYRPAI
jgi:hypothetical protein